MYRKGTYLKRKNGVREDIPDIMKIVGSASEGIKEQILDWFYVGNFHYEIKDLDGKINYYWGNFLKEHYYKISKKEAFIYVI